MDHGTCVSPLQACANTRTLADGKQMHTRILITVLGTKLANLYAIRVSFRDAEVEFQRIPKRNVYGYNARIRGYVKHGYSGEALELYDQMQQEGVAPENLTSPLFLKACTELSALQKGTEVHDCIARTGLGSNVFLANGLLDMNGKWGLIEDARQVFGKMSEKDVASWTVLNTGYIQSGQIDEAWKLLYRMQEECVEPKSMTVATVISACAVQGALQQGKEIHDSLLKRGFECDIFVGRALVDMYAKGPPRRPDPTKQGFNKIHPLRMDADLVQRRLHKTNLPSTEADLIQIFIKEVEGKHICMRLSKAMSIHALKKEIQARCGTPACCQNLIYSGYSMQDNKTLEYYGIEKNSTIIINLRLRGGYSGSSSKNTGSFKDAVNGKGENIQPKPAPAPELPGPYIVEQTLESPTIQVTSPEVTSLHTDLATHAVICRFNRFWPKSDALHHWILSTWSPDCEIHLCSKGFFIVRFTTEQERDNIINQGPWFWGKAGLFTIPWFPEFDANTMKVTTVPIWVRLHNLPLHFWHYKVLTAIGNSLGKFLKTDEERINQGIFTYARLCVEVDLSLGLPDHITLNYNNTQRIQPLDYENTAFRCLRCMQTGHLQNTCPLGKKDPKVNKKQQKKPNGWQHTDWREKEDMQTESTGNQTKPDVQMEQKYTQEGNAPDTQLGPDNRKQQQEIQLEVSGIKRSHGSEGSESDKEQQINTMEKQLAITAPNSNSDGWRRVEKKKGRKA